MIFRQDIVDFVKRDGKHTIGESGLFATKKLVACGLVYVVGVPIALLGAVINLPFRLLGSGGSKPQLKKFDFPPVVPQSNVKPLADREFDIIVFGATGYTGELAAKYLQKQYGNDSTVKWAIAGRRLEALEQVKQRLGGGNGVNIISGVDSFNEQSLLEMCARARVVVSTVGPFQNYGTPLVRACIAAGTNYCDITGEADWYSGLVEAYDVAAREAGVRIVSFCGHDSVPWDLMALMLNKRLHELNNEDMLSVHMEDEIQSGPSGGTVATIQEAIANKGKRPPTKLAFNPLLLTEQGTKSSFETKDTSAFAPVGPEANLQRQWGGPFIMAMVNAQVVRRSNALNGYGKQLAYSEVRLAPSVSVLLGRYFSLIMLAPVLALPAVLQKRLLPQPGTGPSQEELDMGFLQLTGKAVGVHGTEVAARMYFDHDVGYPGTGRLLVESGLCIAQTPDKCVRAGGVLTPATCMGEALLQRLVERGTEFIYLK